MSPRTLSCLLAFAVFVTPITAAEVVENCGSAQCADPLKNQGNVLLQSRSVAQRIASPIEPEEEEPRLEGLAQSQDADVATSTEDGRMQAASGEEEFPEGAASFAETATMPEMAEMAGGSGIPGFPELEYAGALIHANGAVRYDKSCCTGERVSVGKLSEMRSHRGRWAGGGERQCAAKAAAKKGFDAFFINGRSMSCEIVKSNRCIVSSYGSHCGAHWKWGASFAIRHKTMPTVHSISPNAGTFQGGTQVIVNGANLWPGRHGKNDVQDFAPPITICLQNIPCEVDYFKSTSTRVVCHAAAFNETKKQKTVEHLKDPDVEQALTLSQNLCNQVEKQVPGGYVFKQTEFVSVGRGTCSQVSARLYAAPNVNSLEACKKLTLAKGGKAFTWRANRYRGRQFCEVWASHCSQGRGGHSIFQTWSLVPPTPAVFLKHGGEFVGGLVNQKWNSASACYDRPQTCGYAYDNSKAAKVVQVLPTVAAPGDKIQIVGNFFKNDVTDGGKVWLMSPNNPDEPIFCQTTNKAGKAFKTTHTTGLSFFDCLLPVGLDPGEYAVTVFHDVFGEALAFKSLTVRAQIASVQREGMKITLSGTHLKGVKGVEVGGAACSTKSSDFFELTCQMPKSSHWNQEHYSGAPGAIIETVRLGDEVEKMPESFADAEVMAGSLKIEPEFLLSTQLAPPRAVDAAASKSIFFSRAKALLHVPKTGTYMIKLTNLDSEDGDATLVVSGLKAGASKIEFAGQFTLSSKKKAAVATWVKLEAEKLYPVQLERSHISTTSVAGIDLIMCDADNRCRQTFPLDAQVLRRSYMEPQVTGAGVLCTNVEGCSLPREDTKPALVQVASERLQPAAPERARRTKPKYMPMHELAGLRRQVPGLGELERPALLQHVAHLVQQQPITATITTSINGTCYWGPKTLYATLEGCVPGDKGGKKVKGKDCNVYPSIDEALKACGDMAACGGIVYRKDGTAEIRSGRWLKSDKKSEAIEKLACGKWKHRASDAGGASGTRGCNLNGFVTEGEFGKTLENCKKFCMQSAPRRASGFIATRFVEYHNDTYCGCFSTCQQNRHPDKFRSVADIYEYDSADIVTKEHVPYLERYKNNPCLNKVCHFSDPKVWGKSGVPSGKDTDIIYIPENVTLILDKDVSIRYWVVEGTLIPARKNLHIQAEGIFINGGTLRVGTADKPFQEELTFEMMGHWHSFKIPVFGSKVIGLTQGNLEIYGKPIKSTWVELAKTAAPGATTLSVMGQDAALWEAGSRIVVAATDSPESNCDSDRKDSCQTEEAEVVRAEVNQKTDTTILHLKKELRYRHVVDALTGSRGEDMDIRAEVGLLSRNVRVKGAQNLPGTQHFGAQVMMLKLDKVALEYVEFFHVGQAHQLGRYPVHFHHSGTLEGRAHVRGCAIHRTFNRAVTNHGTDKLLVENNVAYNVQGMAYFFEDAVETGALYRNNIGFMIRQSFSLLQVDLTPAVFWVTNPGNHLIGNHAAGAHSFGFWFDIKGGARGLSMGMVGYTPSSDPLATFENNTAHSCGERGLWITNYDPVKNGKRVVAIFERTKTWGNAEGYEALNVGHIWIRNHVSISDGMESVTVAINRATEWGTKENGYDSAAMMDVTIKSKSALPSSLWTQCGVHGPTSDYVNVKGLHVHDSFSKGFFCGCKWCPGPSGGIQVRFTETTFLTKEARTIKSGWRNNFDSLLVDVDGSLSGEGRCHLHGCMLHPPINKGLGYFPPDHCKLRPSGVVCSSSVALRTMRIRDAQPFTTKFKSLSITTPYGSASSGFYFYDFRVSRQAGGLYHYTMVSGLTHDVNWNMGNEQVDITRFGGEICDMKKDEYFLWSTKTLANPVGFRWTGKDISLDRLALMGCPAKCKKAKCIYRLDSQGKCSNTGLQCGGCRVEPNTASNHRLIKVGHECRSRDLPLGEHASVDACAAACLKAEGCKYFVFGHGTKKGRCYHEQTDSEDCLEGWDSDMYDFYAVRVEGDRSNAKLAGVDFSNLTHQKDSNGLWQYTKAVESFDVDKWRAGSFTSLLNTKVSSFRSNANGKFDGTNEARPVSNWGSTQLQPCMSLSFARTEGTASACADDKDEKRFGSDVPVRTIKWCSADWEKDEIQNIYRKTMWEKNDTLIIPSTWTVHFNCKHPVRVKVLEVHGKLIFDEGADRHLTATHIIISHLGALQIGTAKKPFANKAVISLDGHRRTPAWPAMGLGSKFIASSGRLDLYGHARPTWTRLAKGVAAGGVELELASDLLLKVGDEVLVTTTAVDAGQTEKHTVASVKGSKVTLSKKLQHAHDGLDTILDGHVETKGMMAAEVAVLRGNIVIEGLDTPGFKGVTAVKDEKYGAVIKVFTVSDICGALPAQFHMQGVDLRYCGRDTTHCVNAGNAAKGSFIHNSVVRDGLGNGFMGGFAGIKIDSSVVSSRNLIYNIHKGHGMSTTGVTSHNLVTSCGYGYKGFDGGQDFTDNVASGISNYAMFKQPGGVCAFVKMTAPGKWKALRNVFRSCKNGVIASGGGAGSAGCIRTLPSKSAYQKTTACGAVEHLTIIHAQQFGLHAYGATMLLRHMTFINANKAVSLAGTGPGSKGHSTAQPDIRLQVTDSSFFAKSGRCGGFGVASGVWYNGWLRLHRPLLAPSLYGGTVVEGVKFYGYGTCEPALVNDAGAWQVALHDGEMHTMFTAKLKFIGGKKSHRVRFLKPGNCLQMPCDGRRSSIVVDTDGTLMGEIGTVVARVEQGFKYELLPHTQRFDSKGQTIPESTLYKAKGAYRKGCKLNEAWNAWTCPGGQHRILLIESMDPDWLERRYAPVSVEANDKNAPYGGNVALYTGPGTGNTGMIQAFWTVAHLGVRHNIYFASSNPIRTRVHLRDAAPDQGVVLCVYYGLPNRVEVFVKGKRAHALAEPTWDNQKLPAVDASMPIGANVYDRIGAAADKRPGYLYVVAKGPQPIELIVSKKIKLTQKLESGEQEFVYKKGSQGLVRNLALLLNIPESRIKVVGLGSMKDGEIWGKHNGVDNGYKPPSLLQTDKKPELMQVVIDAAEAENEDEVESNAHELSTVYKNAKGVCKKSDVKCLKDPEIDSIPVDGWQCDADKYGSGDGCDCDCGIWDPDCDKSSKWGYGVAQPDGEIKLLDTLQAEALLKDFDKKPKDHNLGTEDLFSVHETLSHASPLRALADEINKAGKQWVPLLKLAGKSSCAEGKRCLMNPKIPLTKEALPAGVCVNHPVAKKGSACDSDPCGKCSDAKCVGSTQNSWGYKCVPTAKSVAFMSKSTAKFFEFKHHCWGRRRRRKCAWKLVATDKKIGNKQFSFSGFGECKAEVLKKFRTMRRANDCIKEGVKLGGKGITWTRRFNRRYGQSCTIYKEACTSIYRAGRKDYRFAAYELQERVQKFELMPTATGQFQVRSGASPNVCLEMGTGGPHGATCTPTEACWVRMPKGCAKKLGETSTPERWFVDPHSRDAARCTSRLKEFNAYCSRSDATSQWRSQAVAKEQLWDIKKDCKGDDALKSQEKCVQTEGENFVAHACESHIPGQQLDVIGV